jgi:hypothetical protein
MAARREPSFQRCQGTRRHHNPDIRSVLESVISLLGEFQEAHNDYRAGRRNTWGCMSPLLEPVETFTNGNEMRFDDYFRVSVRQARPMGELKWTCIVEFRFRNQSIFHMTLIYNPPGTTNHEWQDGVHFTSDLTGRRTFLQPDAIRRNDFESTYVLGDQLGQICFDMATYFRDGVSTSGAAITDRNLYEFLQLPPHLPASEYDIRNHIHNGLMIFGVAVKAIVLYDRWKNLGTQTTKREVFDQTDRLRLQINLRPLTGDDRDSFMDDGFRGTDDWLRQGRARGAEDVRRRGGGLQKKLIVYSRKIQKIKELTKILNKNKSKNKIKIEKYNKQIKELKEKIKNTKEKLKKQKLKKQKLKKEKLNKEKLRKEKLKKGKLKKEKLKKVAKKTKK